MRLLDVLGPDAGRQTIHGLIAEGDGLVDVLEAQRGEHRSEDLFLRDGHLGSHLVEDGGLDEVAGPIDALPARPQLGAFRLARLHVAQHALHLFFRDDRAQPGVLIEGIARRHLLGPLDQLLDERVVDARLDEQPRARGAHFPLPIEDSGGHASGRGLQIGVGEHDVGRFAAQLQGDGLERRRRLAHDRRAHLGRAGERDLVHVGVADQRAAGAGSEARHHVEDAGRESGLARQLGEAERGERGLLGGLQHHGVSAGEGRGQLPHGEQQWEVPGNDGADHAQRLAPRVVEQRTGRRDRLALNLVGPAGVVTQHGDGLVQIDLPRLEVRLAVLQRLDPRQLVGVPLDPIGQPVEQGAALAGGHPLPGVRLEGTPRRLHGPVDVRRLGLRDFCQRFALGGVLHREGRAVRRVDELAVYEELGLHLDVHRFVYPRSG